MITDSQTDYLYLADTLPVKYPDFYERFRHVLKTCNLDVGLLPYTKDVWAVDYMPIQVAADHFISFLYRPSYLVKYKKYQQALPDVDAICAQIGIRPVKSGIILDGGNVIRAADKVILTDRVFKDNPGYERRQLLKELYELLQADHIYLVPEQLHDFTGHADGMVRFLNDDTVLINDYRHEPEAFCRAFEIAIHNTGLDYVKIPYSPYHNDRYSQANGYYINYLQMMGTVIVPTFGIKEDDAAVRQLELLFSGQKIAVVESNDLATDGGVLNCITWNIKSGRLAGA